MTAPSMTPTDLGPCGVVYIAATIGVSEGL